MKQPTTPCPSWLIELPTCDSTNTWALAHREALAHGACVWTRAQTGGRGRGGNRWHAPPGVLTATFAIDPGRRTSVAEADRHARQIALAAGLAIAHAVEDLASGARVMIKWPNDCYMSDRKLAGVLCERGSGSRTLVVGIGLNLDPRWDQDPAALASIGASASVAEACTHADVPDEVSMLSAIRRYLLEAAGLVAAGAWKRLLVPMGERDWLAGKSVEVRDATVVRGVASGFDGEGRLKVAHDRTSTACSGGSVTVVANAARAKPGARARSQR
ncbi:MAG: biotin--[acetyl-CoA-carboxylase] ligase [Planctomycetes bacterium]|nr:biotin--[acetyl-CoA-carboxylase] ligase [Planctomycetota bacterium]